MQRDDPAARAFEAAINEGEADTLRALFVSHPRLVDVIDEPWFGFEAPALVHAAGRTDRAMVDALLDLGADPDARSAWDAGPYSALHRCVDGATPERLELAEHLLARGATLDAHAAAGMGLREALRELLDAQPDQVSAPGPDGATPLHLARTPEVAALLLERGAEIEKRCVDHSSTPLMWSVQGPEDVTRFLLEQGAKPDLFIAAALDDVALAESILAVEPDAIDVSVRYGQSHPHLGFGDKYVWAFDFADTPLEVARRRSHDAVYRFLLERSSPAACLLQACRRGDTEDVERILGEHSTLLGDLSAAQVRELLTGSPVCTRMLLRRGVDPNALDDDAGATALHHASWHSDRELIEALLEQGADPSIRDARYSSTPLGWANENGHADVVEMLAEAFPPDLLDSSWLGRTERVRELLAADSSLAVGADEARASPLRTAAWHGHTEIVRLLLDHGADPAVRHVESGKHALDLAVERGHTEIERILREHRG